MSSGLKEKLLDGAIKMNKAFITILLTFPVQVLSNDWILPALDALVGPRYGISEKGTPMIGNISYTDRGNKLPVKAQRVYLLRDGSLAASRSSDLSGNFTFFGNFSKGRYSIEIDSSRYKCNKIQLTKKTITQLIEIECKKR